MTFIANGWLFEPTSEATGACRATHLASGATLLYDPQDGWVNLYHPHTETRRHNITGPVTAEEAERFIGDLVQHGRSQSESYIPAAKEER